MTLLSHAPSLPSLACPLRLTVSCTLCHLPHYLFLQDSSGPLPPVTSPVTPFPHPLEDILYSLIISSRYPLSSFFSGLPYVVYLLLLETLSIHLAPLPLLLLLLMTLHAAHSLLAEYAPLLSVFQRHFPFSYASPHHPSSSYWILALASFCHLIFHFSYIWPLIFAMIRVLPPASLTYSSTDTLHSIRHYFTTYVSHKTCQWPPSCPAVLLLRTRELSPAYSVCTYLPLLSPFAAFLSTSHAGLPPLLWPPYFPLFVHFSLPSLYLFLFPVTSTSFLLSMGTLSPLDRPSPPISLPDPCLSWNSPLSLTLGTLSPAHMILLHTRPDASITTSLLPFKAGLFDVCHHVSQQRSPPTLRVPTYHDPPHYETYHRSS